MKNSELKTILAHQLMEKILYSHEPPRQFIREYNKRYAGTSWMMVAKQAPLLAIDDKAFAISPHGPGGLEDAPAYRFGTDQRSRFALCLDITRFTIMMSPKDLLTLRLGDGISVLPH